jgi:hypothetical protein
MDSEVKAEYEAFQQTLSELDGLRFVSSPVPADLHDKIAARLDLQVWEQKRVASVGWAGWLRNVALGGVAAAAVVGAILSIASHGQSANASGIGTLSTNQLLATPVDKGVKVSYIAASPKRVSVQSGEQMLRVDELAPSQRWESTLTNSQPHAALFRVGIAQDSQEIEVTIPGSVATHRKPGNGTIEDLAKALADTYRVPVILSGRDLNQSIKWDFQEQEPAEAAGTALSTRTFTVEVKNGNALWITENN